jgi:hypothetical protein
VPPEVSLYDLLGVDPESDPKEIKAAYYAAIKTCHPAVDRSPDAPDTALLLIDAYRVLGDPDRRRMYNARLRVGAQLFRDHVPAPAERPPERHAAREPVAPAQPIEFDLARTAWGVPGATAAAAGRRRSWRSRMVRTVAAGVGFAAGFALLLVVFSNLKLHADGTTETATPAASAAAFAQTAPGPTPTVTPCLDVGSGLTGDSLYRECVKTRVKLHLRMMRLTSGVEMERDELQDAMAEMRQAVGAAQIKMTSTKGFIEESVATFAEIKNSATDKQVRRIAENYYYYYDCEALKHCAQ